MKKTAPRQARLQLKVAIDGHEFSGMGPGDLVSKQFNEFLALVADITGGKGKLIRLPYYEANMTPAEQHGLESLGIIVAFVAVMRWFFWRVKRDEDQIWGREESQPNALPRPEERRI